MSAYLGHRIYYAVSGGVVRGSYLWYDNARARGASEDEIVAEFPPAAIEGDERGTTVYRFKQPG